MNRTLLLGVILASFLTGAAMARNMGHRFGFLADMIKSFGSIDLPVREIVVSSTPSVPNVQQLGVNIGEWAYYGTAAGEFQNLVQNPGFERSEAGRVVVVPSSGLTSAAFCDNNNYWPYPSGFFGGANFQDVYVTGSGSTATAATRGTGTITGYNPTGCANSTPQFTYSAGFQIQAGDYLMFHGTGNLNPGLQNPGYPPAGWWNNDPQWTLVADNEPNSDGKQALDLPLNGSSHSINTGGDSCGGCYTNPSGGTQNFILVRGPWKVSLWAKAVGASADAAVNVRFGRIGVITWINQTFTPASAWTQYTWTFTGDETSLTSGVSPLQFTITGNGTSGHIRFDDVFVGPASASAPPWSNEFVSVLQTLHPGVIRAWQSDEGDSYANMIADDAARGTSNTYAGGSTSGGWMYSLDGFLKLASKVRAVPWVNVPMDLTDSELSSLGNYLAVEQSKYDFSAILLEFADEQWNGVSCGGVCTSFSADIYTAVDGRAFGIIKAAAGTTPVQAVAGSQNNPSVSSGVAKAYGMNYETIFAYYLYCDNTGKGTATYMSDMLGDPAIQLATFQSLFSGLNGLGAVIYESGPSTWWGTMSNAERNGTIAGAASATADAELALNWWSAGGAFLTAWNLSQTNFDSPTRWSAPGLCSSADSPPHRMEAYMWGLVHDFYMPLIRPRGLATELLNRYFILTKTGNFHPATVSGYRGVVAGAWEDLVHGYGWNVAAVNTTPRARRVVVRFPSGARLPTGRVWQINHWHAITDQNEECANAKGRCNPSVTAGQGAPIAAGPGSNAIALSLPPYGLVVGQASPKGAP